MKGKVIDQWIEREKKDGERKEGKEQVMVGERRDHRRNPQMARLIG